MSIKKFIAGGLVGGIVDFLLGWILWGIVFANFFPMTDETKMNMLFIFLGCMTFAFFISFIFTKWAHISTPITGLKAGAIIGLFISLFHNFFHYSDNLNPNYQVIGADVLLTVFSSALVGAVIALVHGKIND